MGYSHNDRLSDDALTGKAATVVGVLMLSPAYGWEYQLHQGGLEPRNITLLDNLDGRVS